MSALQDARLRLVMFLVTGAMFMEVLDGNIIATALPDMSRSFGIDAVRLNVAISAYLLALGAFIPVSGWMTDRYGPRRVFACAIAGFTLTSLGCGLVENLHAFVVLRVLQGASGALMVPVGRLLVLRHTPQERRMAAMSNLVWPALVAPVIAPPLGGFIASHLDWHWIFFLNVPLGILGFVLALWLIPPLEPAPRRPFDWTGFALCGLGIFALLGALERLAATIDPAGLALLAGGAVLAAAALRHLRRAVAPMLSLAPLRIATFRVVAIGGSVTRMAIGSLPFLLPLMFQLGFGMNAFEAGLLLLVVFAGNLGMKAVTTPILRRFGYRPVMLWNGLLAAASLAACALLTPSMPLPLLLPILFVHGMARSMQFTCLGTLAFADVPEARMADANGLFNVVSQLGMAAGITLGALAVRLGEALAGALDIAGQAFPYRVAFMIAAGIALAGLLDTVRLPKGAGDHFVARPR
ncbi:MFS transporter [Castellaniella defragrans]|uniref:EmrB/QacA subfamily drug resistance transporter n=1 Tax=Castellaniella defragrans TaxID=75697 RepID=A0A7W9TPZ1_CASDE|nr:MFS transporter [Castellaniella defragrans]KAB0622071.1 multidrug efflux MFS transporter [Castellaniella defragrans]MBB6084386.1 EmrB/QacA subfamily drug resistance transporter [Castellaniella defragrans]